VEGPCEVGSWLTCVRAFTCVFVECGVLGVGVSGDSLSSWIKGFRGPVFPDLEVGSGGIRARCGSVSDWM
jgi:hypothetical protein